MSPRRAVNYSYNYTRYSYTFIDIDTTPRRFFMEIFAFPAGGLYYRAIYIYFIPVSGKKKELYSYFTARINKQSVLRSKEKSNSAVVKVHYGRGNIKLKSKRKRKIA